MGPLCYLVLINDALTNTPHRWKYVDDCTLGVPIDNKDPDYSVLQKLLEQLQAWTEESRITINHSNTVQYPLPQPTLGLHRPKVVQSPKLLSVTVDDQLTCKQHVTTTVRLMLCLSRVVFLSQLHSTAAAGESTKEGVQVHPGPAYINYDESLAIQNLPNI
ncbi:hypothetical protein E2C01_029790 [Portunus trituberculatus]|uniref:Reverse transcriptase domain-containing protein n=1 Tax=Portunus trituberculatus TaxID=210409 RepID=A0A5B7ESE6_PORTR|nr:hypothetical protein [Portunus trituberculatus]